MFEEVFMFSARDKDGKILHLLKESSVSKGDYFCPGCGGDVYKRQQLRLVTKSILTSKLVV